MPIGESIVVNPKEFPNITAGNVVEIFHPEDETSRLLLQVPSLRDDFQQKDTISVEQSVANAFNLRTYKDVRVNVVDSKSVALDLMEIVFREQYYSRSDMWRLSKTLVNTCVYASKKIEFAEMRAQVNELWSKGEKMTCGYVTEDTRVVFRSSTAVISIFIQMSSEMWEFDAYGDLYFEKAVCGFLAELFAKWKENNCSHDVTIVMFSRTFYDAQSKDELPHPVRECITQDYKGRFYEDFYRVVVQNERYDEWTSVLIELKKLFVEYPKRVLHFHDSSGHRLPRAWNSTAAQGNFLEVINMSLNSYEKYYIDRNFDRTGKVAVVITPGAGVFEVDRELMNVTKQRTIDYGIGADIVCMAEQPLHAVPLFKFHNKNDQTTLDVGDDYNLPHWINISFYHSNSQEQGTNSAKFVPRIKLGIKNPNRPLLGMEKNNSKENVLANRWREQSHDNFPFVDYDEYDSNTFKLPSKVASMTQVKNRSSSAAVSKFIPQSFQEALSQHRPRTRTISDDYLGADLGNSVTPKMPIPYHSSPENLLSSSYSGVVATSMGGGITQESNVSESNDDLVIGYRSIVGSETSLSSHLARTGSGEEKGRPHRALINPFAPMRLNFKMTSNRRRWIHAFPIDPQGTTIRSHYHRFKIKENKIDLSVQPPTKEVMEAAQLAVEIRKNRTRQESSCNESDQSSSVSPSGTLTRCDSTTSTHTLQQIPSSSSLSTLNRSQSISKVQSNASISSMVPKGSYDETFAARAKTPTHSQKRLSSILRELEVEKTGRWLWGPPGEKEWSPSLTMAFWTSSDCLFTLAGGRLGVDWKSLCYPAQLPMTTDYFPDQEALQKYYVFTDYSLLPDDYNQDVWQRPSGEDASKYNHKPLTCSQVFKELISQRMAQGFQLIVQPKTQTQGGHSKLSSSPRYNTGSFYNNRTWSRPEQEQSEEYNMSIGRIFHKLNLSNSSITVTRYRPRHSAPNILVHYRYRLQVPDSKTYDISWADFRSEQLESYNWNYLDLYICTRGESDFGLVESLKFWRSRFFLLPLQTDPATEKIIQGSARCDIYEERCIKEQCQIVEGYLRFIETINKIRRPSSTRKQKISEARRASHEYHCQKKLSAPSIMNVSALRRNSDPRPIENSLTQYFQSKMKTTTAANVAIQKPSLADGLELKPEVANRVRHPSMPAKVFASESTMDSAPLVTASSIPHSPAPDVKKSTSSQSSTVISQSSEIASVTLSYADSDNKQIGVTDNSTSESDDCLTINSLLTDIVEAMLDANEGLSFLPKQPGLPPHCFISAEAVAWVRVCVQGVMSDSMAVDILQKMLDAKLICHPSNDPKHKFINGFFLFTILPRSEQGVGPEAPVNSLFSNEWCEVEIDLNDKPPPEVRAWLEENLPPKVTPKKPRTSDCWRDTTLKNIGHENFKQVNVDVDSSAKSDRKEWGIAFYHSKYNPLSPFSLEIQWMVATGCIMGELIYSYARKASSCGFHFLPVPLDQFALPYTPNSDPLRGPVFIPLNVACLKTPGISLFGEFKDERPWERLELFQDAILKRFGFMRDLYSINLSTSYGLPEDISMKYVHCTGGMFALIPDHNIITSPKAKDRVFAQKQQRQSVHKDFIARHLSINGVCDPGPQDQIGFIWSWNFMLTKRWRTSNTGDEHFQDKVLKDFRDFCNNEDNRLRDFWDESWEKARQAAEPVEMLTDSEFWSVDPNEETV
ncbi:GATOR1 complex protein DEPDC5-like [Lineus longissimus]|uniref:GATOR1 complex protein DEPDC5-like n=1 Tax=Lineus longissimus TaxID=88925 RepID=UPI00315DEF37